MKRLIGVVVACAFLGAAATAMAGDYHYQLTLQCQQCHVAHGSQTHGYTTGGTTFPPLVGAPHKYLLRQEPNELCLACHNDDPGYPDVLGNNAGESPGILRLAGGLNTDHVGYSTLGDGFDLIDGHTLWSTDPAPSGTSPSEYVPPADGLECVSCHAQHGGPGYRNLLHRGIFSGDTIKVAVGTNDLTKDVFERSAASYAESDVDFNEPNATASKYAKWCGNCHTDFHGGGTATNMGSHSGDHDSADYWMRHPVQDVDLGHTGTGSHIASLSQYNGRTNKVKMMSTSGTWTGTSTDLTPSCMSCHKGHGNKNPFGLVYMAGTGTRTEQGVDGALYKDLCRQCHSQGAD